MPSSGLPTVLAGSLQHSTALARWSTDDQQTAWCYDSATWRRRVMFASLANIRASVDELLAMP